MASPNGGSTVERERLSGRYTRRLSVRDDYSRKIVSYQGNRQEPGLRWMKYKEGFSRQLVSDLIEEHDPKDVLDPFAGVGTTPLVATGSGRSGTGIEIMPIGVLAGKAIAEASNGVSALAFDSEGRAMVRRIRSRRSGRNGFAFPHVPITMGAFPEETEEEITRARTFLSCVENRGHHALLELACVSVLEESSYTRKDGQYLRWDSRSGRRLRSKMDKGPVTPFSIALERRLAEMVEDIDKLKAEYGHGWPNLITGSCLALLKDIPECSFDMVITSPPYANRYDYTRTYALELAWLGFDKQGFSELRQQLLSATVENKAKTEWLEGLYEVDRGILDHVIGMHASQGALHEVLDILQDHKGELSNRNILQLIEQYFPGNGPCCCGDGSDRSPRRSSHHGERQCAIPWRGLARGLHPIRLCRAIRI